MSIAVNTRSKSLNILQISDGKPGHIKQATALIEAIDRLRTITHHSIEPLVIGSALRRWAWPGRSDIHETVKIVIGVGHATHLSVLALGRQHAASTVIIMNPSLPAFLFDAVITPAHDGFNAGANRLTTPLSLAPQPENLAPQPQSGLILLGGNSRHFSWSNDMVIKQLRQLGELYPDVSWEASTSRRTPTGFIDSAKAALPESMVLLDWQSLPPAWLTKTLSRAGHIWVTEDSASMLSEAMSTSACVGLIELNSCGKHNKLRLASRPLIEQRRLATLALPYPADYIVRSLEGLDCHPACGSRPDQNLDCARSLLALLDL